MDHAHRLDAVFLVLLQALLDQRRLNAMPPARRFRQLGIAAAPFQDFGRQAQPPRQPRPQRGELAGLVHHHMVAGAQQIDQGRFPGAGAGRRIDHHRMDGLEDALDARRQLQAQGAEFRPAMVDGGQAQRAQNAVRHRAGAGNLQEMMTRGMEIERQHVRPLNLCVLWSKCYGSCTGIANFANWQHQAAAPLLRPYLAC